MAQFTPLTDVLATVVASHFPGLTPMPTVAPSAPTDPDDMAQRSRKGMASATSMLELCLNELDGTFLDRDCAQAIARRVINAYLDQMQIRGTK